MPHYADGSKAESGDPVVCLETWKGHPVSGVVVNVIESDLCNLTVAIATAWTPGPGMRILGFEHVTLTAKSCEHADRMAKRLADEKAAREKSAQKRDELVAEIQDVIGQKDLFPREGG